MDIMFTQVAMILTSCCLFIHLGLGNAICKIIRYNFILFQCPKCLSFWSVLCYLLLINQSVIVSFCIAFICAYMAIWIDLLLTLIANWYEEIYESVGAKESQDNTRDSNEGSEGEKK